MMPIQWRLNGRLANFVNKSRNSSVTCRCNYPAARYFKTALARYTHEPRPSCDRYYWKRSTICLLRCWLARQRNRLFNLIRKSPVKKTAVPSGTDTRREPPRLAPERVFGKRAGAHWNRTLPSRRSTSISIDGTAAARFRSPFLSFVRANRTSSHPETFAIAPRRLSISGDRSSGHFRRSMTSRPRLAAVQSRQKSPRKDLCLVLARPVFRKTKTLIRESCSDLPPTPEHAGECISRMPFPPTRSRLPSRSRREYPAFWEEERTFCQLAAKNY